MGRDEGHVRTVVGDTARGVSSSGHSAQYLVRIPCPGFGSTDTGSMVVGLLEAGRRQMARRSQIKRPRQGLTNPGDTGQCQGRWSGSLKSTNKHDEHGVDGCRGATTGVSNSANSVGGVRQYQAVPGAEIYHFKKKVNTESFFVRFVRSAVHWVLVLRANE